MTCSTHPSIAEVIKQYGLPQSHRTYWSKSRKAKVVRAVREEALSFSEAREIYLLSRSEYRQWEREYLEHGAAARAFLDA